MFTNFKTKNQSANTLGTLSKKVFAFCCMVLIIFSVATAVLHAATPIKIVFAQNNSDMNSTPEELAAAQQAAGTTNHPTTPSKTPGWTDIAGWVDYIIVQISLALLALSSWVLGAAGLVLNTAIKLAVVDFARYANSAGVLLAWKTFRDLANMTFIFVLLYIAIMTILDEGGIDMKKMLTRIIIIALLLNFSMFFTKLFIDGSNIVAIGFYNQLTQVPCGNGGTPAGGISEAFMCNMGLTDIYSVQTFNDLKLNPMRTLSYAVFGSLFMLIAAFVFAAAAIMFVARSVIFIFLLILSPIAFVSKALPEDKVSGKWWNKLFEQCLTAPVFLAMLWAAFQVVGAISIHPRISDALTATGIDQNGHVMQATTAVGETILNFGIIIGMLIGSLMLAIETGAWGASGVMDKLKGAQKWTQAKIGAATFGTAAYAGRRTAGLAGRVVADSEKLKTWESQGGLIKSNVASLVRTGAKKTAETSFDGRGLVGGALGKPEGKGGYDKYVKDREEASLKRAKDLAPSKLVTDRASQRLDAAKKASGEIASAKTRNTAEEQRLRDAMPAEIKGIERMRQEQEADQKKLNDPKISTAEKQVLQVAMANREREINTVEKTFGDNPQVIAFRKFVQKNKELASAAETELAAAQAEVDKLKGVSEDDAGKRFASSGKEKETRDRFESSGAKADAEKIGRGNGLKDKDLKEFIEKAEKAYIEEEKKKFVEALKKDGQAKIRGMDYAKKNIEKSFLQWLGGTRAEQSLKIRSEFSKSKDDSTLDKLISELNSKQGGDKKEEKKEDDKGGKK